MPLEFDGDNDYLDTATLGGAGFTGITASCWVYDKGLSTDGIRVAISRMVTDHNDYHQWLIGRNNGSWLVRTFSGDGDSYECTSAATLNTWTHLCMTVVANGTMYLYVNGLQTDSNDFTAETIHATGEPELVGARNKNGTIQSFYKGLVHDARVYDRQMNATEVLSLYTTRGRDRDLFGLKLRWQLSDNTTGAAGSVKETGPSQLVVTIHSSPAYAYPGVLKIA